MNIQEAVLLCLVTVMLFLSLHCDGIGGGDGSFGLFVSGFYKTHTLGVG